jgi:hypothetical protein
VGLGRVVFAACGVGCFNPTPHPGDPCAMGVCPTGLVCVPSSQTCELTITDAGIDGPINLGSDAGGPAATCFGSGFVTACFASPPSGSVILTGSIDTDTDTRCDATVTATCNIGGRTVMTSGTVRATGSRPLVLVGADTVDITGVLDVASHVGSDNGAAANGIACGSATMAMAGSLAGTPGGSFTTAGGVGGIGADGAPGGKPATPASPTSLRGGCAGGSSPVLMNGGSGAAGGAGGGAVYVIAGSQIVVLGTIDASGAGGEPPSGSVVPGEPAGGCGGGAGGMVGFDAPTISVTGTVLANGGGGAGGGDESGKGGVAGSDPSTVTAAAGGAGGSGADPLGSGGNGGVGSTGGGTGAAGGTGGEDGGAGGGGGGGEGAIVVFGVLVTTGNVSPPPTKK